MGCFDGTSQPELIPTTNKEQNIFCTFIKEKINFRWCGAVQSL